METGKEGQLTNGIGEAQALQDRISNRTVRVAVVGLGYVGLPLAVAFARAGLQVTGLDLDKRKVESVRAGKSYLPDVDTDLLADLVESGKLHATGEESALGEADAVIICVPTPLSKTKDPDLGYVVGAAKAIAQAMHAGQLVVLESTTYPGTTEEVILPILEAGGMRVGEEFFLAFSPERVDPGNQRYNIENTPKVVGGVTPTCLELVRSLYALVMAEVVPVSSTRAAEMVKLLENTFRSVNIGLVNEVSLMCDRLGIDVWEVIEAAATKPFGFMPFFPGPGLGGHCIPVDPVYLSWKLKTLNYRARFIELASEVNAAMPEYVVSRINDALNDRERSVRGSRILVLGVAYKRNVSDVRESPALDVIRLLDARGANVSYHDPFVPTVQLEDRPLHSTALEEGVKNCDLVAILTDHSGIDYAAVVREAQVVFDTRNVTRDCRADNVLRL